ncbi:hypothetical protein LTR10_012854 [Elasticomyces elasticus]|nr:hypothetical protein LTR10_012854 [Elasticomyces elasticus]KAK4978724.1 hypothetical protein LTR42_001224 [Elasticomyces elasticus]
MPYTALQYLNLLARYNKWQYMYAYPLHRGESAHDQCRLRAVEAETTRSSQQNHKINTHDGASSSEDDSGDEKRKKRKIIIFKRTGPGSNMNWFQGVNPPCGLLGCRVCGVFLEMMIEDTAKQCPGLVSAQPTRCVVNVADPEEA